MGIKRWRQRLQRWRGEESIEVDLTPYRRILEEIDSRGESLAGESDSNTGVSQDGQLILAGFERHQTGCARRQHPHKNGPPSDDELIREQQELLAHFQQRLKEATEAKKQSAQRYDEEIARHKEMVTRLEKEIRDAKTPPKPASRRKPSKRG